MIHHSIPAGQDQAVAAVLAADRTSGEMFAVVYRSGWRATLWTAALYEVRVDAGATGTAHYVDGRAALLRGLAVRRLRPVIRRIHADRLRANGAA